MENASKALLIAGGIFMALIVISALVMTYRNIVTLKQTELEQSQVEQISDFNEPFMSYNKSAMYGSDLISVLNLAIDNNTKYKAKTPADDYYVDISFEIKDNLCKYTYTYTLDTRTGKYSSECTGTETIVYGLRTYQLSKTDDYTTIKDKILGRLGDEESKTVIVEKDGATLKKYQIINNEIFDLKRKTFTCTKMETDSEGKIKSMTFKQKTTST